jgi:hypothetical protein
MVGVGTKIPIALGFGFMVLWLVLVWIYPSRLDLVEGSALLLVLRYLMLLESLAALELFSCVEISLGF